MNCHKLMIMRQPPPTPEAQRIQISCPSKGSARHRVSCRHVSREIRLPYWLLRHLHAAVTFEDCARMVYLDVTHDPGTSLVTPTYLAGFAKGVRSLVSAKPLTGGHFGLRIQLTVSAQWPRRRHPAPNTGRASLRWRRVSYAGSLADHS